MEPDQGPDRLVRAYCRARWGAIAGVWGAIFMLELELEGELQEAIGVVP
jgi:hypothetical protein